MAPETTDNYVGRPLELTFDDNRDWRNSIKGIKFSMDNGATFQDFQFRR